MKRIVLLAVTAMFSTGCAFFQGLVKQVDPTTEYRERAEKRCGPLKNLIVGLPEEREIGGAIAIGLVQKKGVFVELSDDLPSGPLNPEEWKDKDAHRPIGERADVTAYVNRVGRYLTQFSVRPPLDPPPEGGQPLYRWTFVVLDTPDENAFSAPGGYVFVTKGLLKKVANEAQLAAVLAHEIGHVTARDSIKAYMDGKFKACYGVSFLADVSKFLPNVPIPKDMMGGPAAALSQKEQVRVRDEFLGAAEGKDTNPSKRSADFIATLTDIVVDLMGGAKARDVEFAADATASQLLTAAGYDRTQVQAIIKRLPDGGGLSPHPSNKDRCAKLDELQKADGDAFAGKAAPDNAEQLKALRK